MSTPPRFTRAPAVNALIANRYEIKRSLGQGGFGVVSLVQDRDSGELYAFKSLRGEKHSERAVQSFREEAKVWLALGHHPYMVEAYFVVMDAGRLYLAMEYVPPGEEGRNSLAGYFMGGPLPLDRLMSWTIQFCYGMEYAYAHGLRSHRDIKPQNILIGPNRRVKITDFGLAQPLPATEQFQEMHLTTLGLSVDDSRDNVPRKAAGTPTHMAPEQFNAEAAGDERTDLYSFGIVLYQMTTGGQLPFLAPAPAEPSQQEYRRFIDQMWQLHRESELPRTASPIQPLLERCLQKDPEDRYRSFAELRAEAEVLLNRVTGAVEPPPLSREPATAVLTRRGYSLLTLGSLDVALQLFEQALHLHDGNAPAWNGKGRVLSSRKRFATALPCFERALRLNPGDIDARTNQSFCQYMLGQYIEASEGFEMVLETEWSSLAAWNGLGNCHFVMGLYEEALTSYETALTLDENRVGLVLNKGMALHKLRRFVQAHASVDRAIALAPSSATTLRVKGHLLIDESKPADAIPYLERALAIKPGSWTTLQAIGNARLMMREDDNALSCYSQALQLAPWQAGLWSNAGVALFELGRYEESAHHLRQATNLDPKSELSRYNRGTFHLLRMEKSKALAQYDRALLLNPEVALTWFHSGLAYSLGGHFAQARTCFIKSLQLGLDDPAIHFNIGIALQQLQIPEKALDSFREVVRRSPQDAEAWERRGECYAHLGATEDARTCRGEARRLRSNGDAITPKNLSSNSALRLSRFRPFRLGKYRKPLDFTSFSGIVAAMADASTSTSA